MINTDRGEIDDNFKGWRVTSLNSKSIEIALEFENPLLLNSGDQPELLVI